MLRDNSFNGRRRCALFRNVKLAYFGAPARLYNLSYNLVAKFDLSVSNHYMGTITRQTCNSRVAYATRPTRY